MAAIAMRRTKDLKINGRPIVSLPPKTVQVVTVNLTPGDQAKYDRWGAATAACSRCCVSLTAAY